MRRIALVSTLVGLLAAAPTAGYTVTHSVSAEPTHQSDSLAPGEQSRIIGGRQSATPYSFMVSYGQGDTFHECGGALIHPRWILTAQHCVKGDFWSKYMVARIGSLDYTGGEHIYLDRPILHPDVNGQMIDLALIPLRKPSRSTPVQLPPSSPPPGVQTRILGWGRTSNNSSTKPRQLRELDTAVVDPSRCSMHKPAFIQGYELCTDNTGGNQGACRGDSGGPQIAKVNGQWLLVGITSRGGHECGREASIYADVAAGKDWIHRTIAQYRFTDTPAG